MVLRCCRSRAGAGAGRKEAEEGRVEALPRAAPASARTEREQKYPEPCGSAPRVTSERAAGAGSRGKGCALPQAVAPSPKQSHREEGTQRGSSFTSAASLYRSASLRPQRPAVPPLRGQHSGEPHPYSRGPLRRAVHSCASGNPEAETHVSQQRPVPARSALGQQGTMAALVLLRAGLARPRGVPTGECPPAAPRRPPRPALIRPRSLRSSAPRDRPPTPRRAGGRRRSQRSGPAEPWRCPGGPRYVCGTGAELRLCVRARSGAS